MDTLHIKKYSLQHRFIDSQTLTGTYIALLAVVADKAVVDTTPHLAHLRVNPVCGSLICLWDIDTLRQHHDKQHKQPPDFQLLSVLTAAEVDREWVL